MLEVVRRLWGHLRWADGLILEALDRAAPAPGEAVREFAHILGADEVWLARLEQRAPRAGVWPAMTVDALQSLVPSLHSAWAQFLENLKEGDLLRAVSYTNSAAQAFRTPVGDILLHVALHAHYHRGKVNLLLRQSGSLPAPADYIGYARGVAAAITPRTQPPA